MAEVTATELLSRFDPNKPAEKFYVSTSEARGGDHLARKIHNQFATSVTPQHLLFSGHIGCGKSSELLEIADHCRKGGSSSRTRYFDIYVDVDQFMDSRDVDMRDVLLAIATSTAVRVRSGLQENISTSYWKSKFLEIRDLLLSEVEVRDFELGGDGIKIAMRLKSSSREVRDSVRKALASQPEALTDEVNLVLSSAREVAIREGFKDICLFVDGLDKVESVKDRAEGRSDHEAFFVDSATRLTSLRAHTIWTVPLKLVRRFGPEIAQRYDGEPYVLPMIKTFDRTRAEFAPGTSVLKALMRKRFDVESLEDRVAPEAISSLIAACGGHPRQLIRLLEIAIRESLDSSMEVQFPIDLPAIEKAKREMTATITGLLYDEDWPLLAELELNPYRSWSLKEPRRQELLEQNCVLEYLNGDPKEGLDPRWYAVHPLIMSLDRMKDNIQKLQKP